MALCILADTFAIPRESRPNLEAGGKQNLGTVLFSVPVILTFLQDCCVCFVDFLKRLQHSKHLQKANLVSERASWILIVTLFGLFGLFA